eukprot:CAMPEP_0168725922 /NCGR_PEP_ID=MMETSP0724-20121128/4405_1 /TAXON_ID=265536 /ORGANISM="Amphiprora sp., Strain CCMP467" /LENGTH=413 /DNA_ID=CAMNT_0008772725 /DNA_START=13 /DNA_END=1254 /DNA_ORIENTATION=+
MSAGAALMSVKLGLKKTQTTIDHLYVELEKATSDDDIQTLKQNLAKAQDKQEQLLQRKKLEASSNSGSTTTTVPKHAYQPKASPASQPAAVTSKPIPTVPKPVAPKPAPAPVMAPAPPPPQPVATPAPAAPAAPASPTKSGETAEELQARIALLQQQIAEAQAKSPSNKSSKPKVTTVKPSNTTTNLSAPTPETFTPPSPTKNHNSNITAAAPVVKNTKPSADWNRPGWASAMELDDNRAVNTDSINNDKLQKPQNQGYQRKVKAANLDIQKGTFVKKNQKDPNAKPNARLCWIVGRIDDRGVPGKIVMHLYGKDVDALVTDFEGRLKNQSMTLATTTTSVAGAVLTVDVDPLLLHVFWGKIPKDLDAQPNVYGVVQEGHEIVQTLIEAGEAGQPLTIKQAHIFPVKKSKSAF